MKLSDEQLAYIREHLNDRPRIKYIRELGISSCTFYRAARLLGARMRYDLSRKQAGIEECVKKYYPVMSATEMEKAFGYSKTTITKWAELLGVKNTPEKDIRMQQKILDALIAGRKNVDYVALQKKRLATRRLDEWRVWEGKPQQTKFRFAKTPRRVYMAKWNLCHNHGYEPTDKPYVLEVTGATRRMNEAYYEKKYKLEFVVKENENQEGITEACVG